MLSHCHSVATAASNGTQYIKALIFDCDGVIVESEDIHRQAYNAAFKHFQVCCPDDKDGLLIWSDAYYQILQNTVGGGKPKMRYHFNGHGWPSSSVLNGRAPENEDEQIELVDILQEWKTNKYKEIIGSGQANPRPGVLELMDAAQAAGIPVAVCSASTKEATDFVLPSLLGKERFQGLDLYMAGDDVPRKKPDPIIYKIASERLGIAPEDCLVIEDSLIGLQAAAGAGMKCIITFTSSTETQEFPGADSVLESLEGVTFADLSAGTLVGRDDRKVVAAA